MLQSLRENSGKWFVKVLFGAIVLSFVVFGIGDVVRNYSATRPVAKIGGTAISYEEFAHAFQHQVSNIQQKIKGHLSSEQIKKMGLHTLVLDQLIDSTILNLEIKKQNLLVADSLIRDLIHSMPAFQQDGVFKKELFHELLRHNGLTEGGFINDLKRDIQSRQLLSLGANIQLPNSYKRVLFDILNQKRIFATVAIPLDKIKLEKPLTEEELTLYYNKNKDAYQQPELRTVSLITIQAKDLVKDVPVSDEELHAEYDRRLGEFSHPEKRTIRVLIYPTRALAEDAFAALKKSRPATAVIRDVQGGRYEEITVEKQNLPGSIAEVVFQLHAGQTSDVLETEGAYAVYQIVKIDPARTQPLSEVSEKLREDIRLNKSAGFLQEFKNKIEDALAAGTPFSQVAEANKLPIEVLIIDAQAHDAEGKPVTKLSLDVVRTMLEHAFNLAEGKETPIIDVNGQISILVHVDKVTPAFVPEFQAVRQKIVDDATSERKQEEAQKLASKIAQESKNLTDLARFANTHNLPLVSNHTTSLMDVEKPAEKDEKNALKELLTPDLQNRAFQLAVDQAVYGQHPSGKGEVVIMLQKVLPVSVDDKLFDNFSKALGQMMQKEAATILLENFRKQYTITIDENVLNHIVKND